MSAFDPIQWAALVGLALAALLAAACDGKSVERPDGTTTEGGSKTEVRSLKVMSVNIYLGGKKDQPGLDGIACYLRGADVVFLQEVDEGAARVLAEKSGLTNLRFARAQDPQEGGYGVAILSRFPLGSAQEREFPGTKAPYDVLLETTVRLRGELVTLIDAFYAAGHDEDGRRARLEVSRLVVDLLNRTEGPVVLGGDLNAASERPEIKRLAAEMTDSFEAATGERHHCEEPFGRIDYVFFRGPFVVRDYKAPCWPLEEGDVSERGEPGCPLSKAWLSDHPFVTAELEIRNN